MNTWLRKRPPKALTTASDQRGASLLSAMLGIGAVGILLAAVCQSGLQMLQLTQSTLIKSDILAFERVIQDNLSCSKTLGPAPVTTCPSPVVLRGGDGAALTDAQSRLGGYKMQVTCSGTVPDARLVITAVAAKPDPLLPTKGPATNTLFKHGTVFSSTYYPCYNYMNSGPRFLIQTYAPSQITTSSALNTCDCNGANRWRTPGQPPLCHSYIKMACPAGYSAAMSGTDCAYSWNGMHLGQYEVSFVGQGSFKADFGIQQGGVTYHINSNEGFVNCCAPLNAIPNPAFLSCVRTN